MISLRSNLVKRIERLPKPTNAAGAMQPLFEAISNAVHSTQSKYGTQVSTLGEVIVTINTNRNKVGVSAIVEDNGAGLNKDNWEAFTTTDTDHKISIGGKGVGRLLWLDCFKQIQIVSSYSEDDQFKQRMFDFVLRQEDQIMNESISEAEEERTFFQVSFKNLRDNAYSKKFPSRGSFIFQYITSHFLPTFIGGRSPKITVTVSGETRTYPRDMENIVLRRLDLDIPGHLSFGDFHLTLLECSKVASADLKGMHFVHFIAHDRTVHSHCIDGMLGLKYFGDDNKNVFHAVITGDFLDKNVNQERTAFNFEDAVIDRIVRDVCETDIRKFLEKPLIEVDLKQKRAIGCITETYPSVAFAGTDELQQKIPPGELNEDAIYGHLSRERFRRDQRQAEKIRHVLSRLKEKNIKIEEFFSTLKDASQAIEETEQKSLLEYVVRRKVTLDFMELLLERVKDDSKDSSYQREDILHSFICPVRVNTVSDNELKAEAASHDLWIVDERLTFAQYFSSDVGFETLSKGEHESSERPDLLIFDRVHGLRQIEEPSKVLLIEFKRPGRKKYEDDENPQHQIERYVRRLQTGKLEDVRGRPIKLDEKTIFYCFIVADIVGKLDDWTFSWQRTADGRGRVYQPKDGFRGSIELIGWDALIEDARARNRAFFDKAGISGKSYFTPTA